MRQQFTGFIFGAITPIICGIITLLIIPLHIMLFERGLLFPFLGFIAVSGLVTVGTLYFRPKVIERLTPNFMQSKELEKGFIHGFAMTMISLICWYFGNGGSLSSFL